MQIIDSFKTPEDIYYNSNEMNYRLSAYNDTFYLGLWYYGKNATLGEPYFQSYLMKIDKQWKFAVEKRMFQRQSYNYAPKPIDSSIVQYENFQLINNKTLVFHNGAGSMELHSVLNNDGVKILEKESHIYIIDSDHMSKVYCSCDEESTWFCYPKPLEDGNGRYQFLNINEDYEIN